MNILKTRQEIISFKKLLLENDENALKGNTRKLAEYKEVLNQNIPQLTNFQTEATIGIILGDGNLQTNNDGTLSRLICQQGIVHDGFTQHLFEIFEEYVGYNNPLPEKLKNRNSREFRTLKIKQFHYLNEIITNSSSPLPKNLKTKAKITKELYDYITPVSIAYLFCCDGGRVNAGLRSQSLGDGKGIRLNLQSYTQEELELLSTIINTKYSFNTIIKPKEKSKLHKQLYVLDFPGSDYERFIEIISPYIHHSMHGRVPLPRKESSKKLGKQDYVNTYLGNKVNNLNIITTYKTT